MSKRKRRAEKEKERRHNKEKAKRKNEFGNIDLLFERQNLYNNTDLTPYNASGNIYIKNFEIKYK